ncbi:MAG: hypothetical protein QOK02_4467 [Mycobacterium sp.]|jgi:hypothetical protein|nr:hypothetical protein [Mycobacterium sp.]
MTGADGLPSEPGPGAGIDELQADIERTRERLGETVSALADKADVKGRVQDKAAETKEAVVQRGRELSTKTKAHPVLPIVVGVVAALGVVVWLRRRGR